jgi:hypothetical protein
VQTTGRVREIPTSEIHADPARLQWRRDTGKDGTCGRLSNLKVFNPLLAGLLLVWKDPATRQLLVVEGHHRLQAAKRLHVPTLLCREVECATAEEARTLGAICNIAEGHSEPLDAARILRNGVTVEAAAELGITFSGKLAKEAKLLAGLSALTWDAVALGRISVEVAVAIGAASADHNHQDALYRLAACRGWNADQVREAGLLADRARMVEAAESGQGWLIPPPDHVSDLEARIEIIAAIRTRLGSKIHTSRVLTGKRARLLREDGYEFDPMAAKHSCAQAKAVLEKLPLLLAGDSALSQLVDLLTADVLAGGRPEKLVDGSWSLLMEGLGLG